MTARPYSLQECARCCQILIMTWPNSFMFLHVNCTMSLRQVFGVRLHVKQLKLIAYSFKPHQFVCRMLSNYTTSIEAEGTGATLKTVKLCHLKI